MRKALALIAFALVFLRAAPAGAAVLQVEGVDDCRVYTWQDAADRAWGRVRPLEALYPCADGTWVLEKRGRWADGAPPDREGVEEAVAQEVYRLVEMGVPGEVFRGLRIYVLPCASIDFDGTAAAGVARWGVKEVYIAGQSLLWRDVLRHEIGHVVQYVLLGAPDSGWTAANEKGREYLRVRGYDRPLDRSHQERLPWGERASELFAEDFAWWAGTANPTVGSLPEAGEIKAFFDRLFGVDRVSDSGTQND